MLKHLFKSKAHDLPALFEGVYTLKQYMKNLEKQADTDPDNYDFLKYLGDGWECFVEILLHLSPTDNRIGLYHYTPVQNNDNGTDGWGVNIRGEKATAQCKYRTNITEQLTANKDHLSNFIADSMLAHDVVADTKDPTNYRHFVYTTAKGLHFYTDLEMYKGKVYCFGYHEISGLVDNNVIFWDAARKLIAQ